MLGKGVEQGGLPLGLVGLGGEVRVLRHQVFDHLGLVFHDGKVKAVEVVSIGVDSRVGYKIARLYKL